MSAHARTLYCTATGRVGYFAGQQARPDPGFIDACRKINNIFQ
ncbi:hypothetical protein SALB1_1308 [Salinisphaera sp. LB1]|nr:hypothetical protein SALB1_1308 [Salinisphaera sp. LB1]